jgi:hypothetical protein
MDFLQFPTAELPVGVDWIGIECNGLFVTVAGCHDAVNALKPKLPASARVWNILPATCLSATAGAGFASESRMEATRTVPALPQK